MNKVNKLLYLTLALFACLFTACKGNSEKTETTENNMSTPITPEDTTWKTTDGLYAEFNTPKGSIVCKLEYQKAPLTVANFVGLAEGKLKNNAKPEGTPFYDGLTFHRCIPNFMIQGGDPMGTGQGGPGYEFGDEFDPSLRFDAAGILAMANAGPGTNGSQFFITHAPTPHLNDKHSIFGKVVQGQSIVTATSNGDKINSLKIIRVGADAEAFDAPTVFAAKREEEAKKAAESKKMMAMPIAELVAKYYPTAKKTKSGLYYIVEKEGTGEQAVAGKRVAVHYNGTFVDGKKFDSSYDRNQPLPFTLGQQQVIDGWDEGIALMKVGGKVKLIIPYQLAYGESGRPPVIPAKATLIFDTELMGVQ